MKIAVVDDDYTALTLISDYLEDEGFEITKAHNPDEIKDRITEFSVIIMDVMIKHDRTKGIEFIRDMAQENLITPDKLVIFVTNFGREPEKIQNLLEEVKKFINFKWFDKSFDVAFYNTLLQTIQRKQQNS